MKSTYPNYEAFRHKMTAADTRTGSDVSSSVACRFQPWLYYRNVSPWKSVHRQTLYGSGQRPTLLMHQYVEKKIVFHVSEAPKTIRIRTSGWQWQYCQIVASRDYRI